MRVAPLAQPQTTFVASSGNRAVQWGHDQPEGSRTPGGRVQPAALAAALEPVGPRLRRVREQRGLTLTEAAERAGLSKSTLSRLENGQRRPSLELLLPLAQVYRVPIDDLVGAPEVGDPRIRLKPRRVNGRTVLPLTRPGGSRHGRSSSRRPRPGRILAPTTGSSGSTSCPAGCGSSWVNRTWCSSVGEAAEFDTQVPHWFGATGDGPAEVLSIFGRPGERCMLSRAALGRATTTSLRVDRTNAWR